MNCCRSLSAKATGSRCWCVYPYQAWRQPPRAAEQLNKDQHRCSAAIHGNKSRGARTRALADFKSGGIRVLVATDIAARGLDIEELPHEW
ncbi:hypothetical protein MJK72_09745 [Klebsiella pneumoniae]|nr:hypothetical protein MJK72_09745 [Klebsiella pneumoniae]